MRWGKPVATLIQKVTHLENMSVNKDSLFEFFSPEACPANTNRAGLKRRAGAAYLQAETLRSVP